MKRVSEDGMSYSVRERGAADSTDYRLFFADGKGNYISPFHDVPLLADPERKLYNMVVEIPRWTNAKMEMATKEALNPIKQDVKKGQLRFVSNCFPHHGYIWNYGALPQTWEDTDQVDEHTKEPGDGDPIDICEIGERVARRGEIIQVKILGVLAMIDEGETDWKLIAIDVKDPLAKILNDVADVEEKMPGFLRATVEWFRIYKIPDGKPENKFAFDGEFQSGDFAREVIDKSHDHWRALMQREEPPLSTVNAAVDGSLFKITKEEAEMIVERAPDNSEGGVASNSSLDKYFFAVPSLQLQPPPTEQPPPSEQLPPPQKQKQKKQQPRKP